MKKIIMLTFMLLSGLTLSAQTEGNDTSCEYSLCLYRTNIGKGIYEQKIVINNLLVAYFPEDKFYVVQSNSKDLQFVIKCSYQRQLADGRYVYSGQCLDENRAAVIYTKTKLSSFLHNNGLNLNSNHLDDSKAIQVKVDGYNDFFLYPIKNIEIYTTPVK